MTLEELVRLTLRLAQGPVPTPQKKVYGYQEEIRTLLDVLPPAITVRMRVTDACDRNGLPDQAERIPGYLRERLAGHLRDIQKGRRTSVILIQEAVLLARYRVPLSFLYDLTGDAHAVVLHLEEEPRFKEWKFPSYVHYDPEAPASYLERILGSQLIRKEPVLSLSKDRVEEKRS